MERPFLCNMCGKGMGMRRLKLFAGIAIVTAMLLFIPACGKGGDGGGGGTTVTRDMLVGNWVMSTIGGSECTGCLSLKLNADGTGSITDPNGYFFGKPDTARGAWEYAGGSLYISATGYYWEAKVKMPLNNQLDLSIGSSRITLVRGG